MLMGIWWMEVNGEMKNSKRFGEGKNRNYGKYNGKKMKFTFCLLKNCLEHKC